MKSMKLMMKSIFLPLNSFFCNFFLINLYFVSNLLLNFLLVIAFITKFRVLEVSDIYYAFDKIYLTKPIAYHIRGEKELYLKDCLEDITLIKSVFLQTRLLSYVYEKNSSDVEYALENQTDNHDPQDITNKMLNDRYFLKTNRLLGMAIEFDELTSEYVKEDNLIQFYESLDVGVPLSQLDDIIADQNFCEYSKSFDSTPYINYLSGLQTEFIFLSNFTKCDAFNLINSEKISYLYDSTSKSLATVEVRLFYFNFIMNIFFEYDIIFEREHAEGYNIFCYFFFNKLKSPFHFKNFHFC